MLREHFISSLFMLNHSCRVLLVEDEPEDANTIQTMLSDASSTFFNELHTAVLKQKQPGRKNKVLAIEGRYLLLELMGRLAAYYRRYYIGLNKLNLAQNYQQIVSSD